MCSDSRGRKNTQNTYRKEQNKFQKLQKRGINYKSQCKGESKKEVKMKSNSQNGLKSYLSPTKKQTFFKQELLLF